MSSAKIIKGSLNGRNTLVSQSIRAYSNNFNAE